MGSYTEQIANELYLGKWSSYDTYEDDYKKITDYLNSLDFRSFGEGLKYMIEKKATDGESLLDCLKRCFKEQNMDIRELGSPNTPKNWLNGGERPKKGEDSRRKMFVLAFALGLDAKDTAYLFRNVFLDRAFNPRNYRELIYYYCIENKLPFSKAEEMISQVVFEASDSSEKTVYTRMIASLVEQSGSENEIIEYINTHPHNFSVNNISAKAIVEKFIGRAKDAVWAEMGIKYKAVKGEIRQYEEKMPVSYTEYGKLGLRREDLVIPEYYMEYAVDRDLGSTNFMYEFITGVYLEKGSGTGSSPFKNAELPKEISVSFPTPQIFAKLNKNPSYDELRKVLILLFSYCFWRDMQTKNTHEDVSDYYTEQLNVWLSEADLPALYPGNPLDWLFCFCTTTDNPIDTFRGILAEVLDEE